MTIKKWSFLFFEIAEGRKKVGKYSEEESLESDFKLTIFKDSHCAVTAEMRFRLSFLYCTF